MPTPPGGPEAELREAINAVLHRMARPIALGLGGLYLAFTVAHAFLLPPALAPVMMAVAFLTSVGCGGIWLVLRRYPPTHGVVHLATGVLSLAALLNVVLHLYLTGEPRQSTNFLLLLVSAGFLVLSTRWFVFVMAVAVGAWFAMVAAHPPAPEWVHYGIAVGVGALLSSVIHYFHLQTVRRAEQLRLQEVHHRSELEAAKEQAEDMARLKSAFLANMSHEIRTPLTSILGFAEILHEDAAADSEHKQLAGVIHESGRRLLDTLNSVLDLARLESGRMVLATEVLNVAAAAVPAVRYLEPLARKKGLSLTLDLRAPDAWAAVDPSTLTRMLNNLVGNAVKFTERGEVVVTVDATDTRVLLRVHDTGVGIAPSFLPHLFDEFRQESSGLARSHEGSGLGLAITRRLVELQHGTIAVESEKGAGSTFTLSFPRVAPPAGTAGGGRSPERLANAAPV